MADTSTSLPPFPVPPLPPLPQVDTRSFDTMAAATKQMVAAPLTATNSLIDAINNATKSIITATQNAANSILPQPNNNQTTAARVVPVGVPQPTTTYSNEEILTV